MVRRSLVNNHIQRALKIRLMWDMRLGAIRKVTVLNN